jgi:hypothetical protein
LPAAVLVSIGCSQDRAAGLQRPHDVLKISNRARKPINARDHQHVPFADEIEDRGQLGPTLGCGAIGYARAMSRLLLCQCADR